MVFALDIGTRKVAGILGEIIGGKVHIADAYVTEHKKRAMLDGQIHNIEEAVNTVMEVKTELERRNGITIDTVVTALAGRSLHTEKISVEKKIKGEITREFLSEIESECVMLSHARLKESIRESYYCVGYSVSHYALDGAAAKNPLMQIARESIKCEMIVTFLPKPVFESMLAVLRECGLKLAGLTLEPIAALNVCIPEDMRLLNLALVDVGAGTSDIAITENGKITAYGMIPKAGDEITEVICNELLCDFQTGEKVKRGISSNETVVTEDIFGNKTEYGRQRINSIIHEKTNEIAKEIADEILKLNGKAPKAVVMAGGGASLELLRKLTAENLGLPENRVGIRMPKNILDYQNLPEELHGSEGITPLGILDTALFNRGLGFMEVIVNGQKEYVINMEGEIKVKDCLNSAGFDFKKLYARPGNAISFTLNGELRLVRGGRGEHAKIYLNGKEASLDDSVKNNDEIFVSRPKDGEDAKANLLSILPHDSYITVEINKEPVKLMPRIMVNGKEINDMEAAVNDRDVIVFEKIRTVYDAVLKTGFNPDVASERDILITVNGEPVSLKQRNYCLKVNGMEVSQSYELKNMDRIEYSDKPAFFRIRDILKGSQKQKATITVNGKPYTMEYEQYTITMNGKRVTEDEFIINGADITVKQNEDGMIVSHIFNVFPVETERVKGKMLVMTVNGQKAGYTTGIKHGDNVEIKFV